MHVRQVLYRFPLSGPCLVQRRSAALYKDADPETDTTVKTSALLSARASAGPLLAHTSSSALRVCVGVCGQDHLERVRVAFSRPAEAPDSPVGFRYDLKDLRVNLFCFFCSIGSKHLLSDSTPHQGDKNRNLPKRVTHKRQQKSPDKAHTQQTPPPQPSSMYSPALISLLCY